MAHVLEQEIKIFIDSIRPPADLRDKLDIGFSFQNNILEIFEIRPRWDDPNIKINSSVAKTQFIKSRNIWKIFWMRANGKWESYPPKPEIGNLSDFFKILQKDQHGCFWG
jgi:hypothetical protein